MIACKSDVRRGGVNEEERHSPVIHVLIELPLMRVRIHSRKEVDIP